MQFLSLNGRIGEGPFVWGMITVYVLGIASSLLLDGRVLRTAHVAPYAAAQALLLWAWLALHCQRLNDAGRRRWPAFLVASLYALSVAAIAAAIAYALTIGKGDNAQAESLSVVGLAGFYIVILLLIMLFGAVTPGTAMAIITVIVIVVYGPTLVALFFSIWTGTRPPADPPPA